MKKQLFLSAFILAVAFRPAFGQINWSQLPLTGTTAKIIATTPPRFSLSLFTSFPFGEAAPFGVDHQTLQAAAFTPGIAEQLFEKFGGPFALDNPSGQKQNTLEMNGTSSVMPARWNFWKNAFLSAGCSFGEWPGGDYRPAVTAGAGWGF